jgi:hypothetical protein
LAVLNIVLGAEAGEPPVAVLVLLDEPHPAATSTPVARSPATHPSRGLDRGFGDIHGSMVMP